MESQEIDEIKTKLSEIHRDLKLFIENSNKKNIDLIVSNVYKDFSNILIEYMNDDANNILEKNMVKRCEMYEKCKAAFLEFFQKNTHLIKKENITDTMIQEKQSEINGMKSAAPYDRCEKCFREVQEIFEKQVGLMRSMKIYNTEKEKKHDIFQISEQKIVSELLEPLSNKQRLQIMKAVSTDTKSFSRLSEITGLRGGNLTFHLQKLLDADMILQVHGRGDYMITEKGYKVLKTISEIYVEINRSF